LLTSNCAAGDDVAPCYCGARDATTCASNGPDGTGACLAQYNAVTLPAGKKVVDVFTSVASPIGVADNLAVCDIDATCPCVGGVCGNGVIDPGEQCDPPKAGSCSPNCQVIGVCGDGVVQTGEQCDDGAANGTPGDHCTTNCTFVQSVVCGDGIVQTGEQCDDGAKNGTAGDPCASNCTLVPIVCGNGIVQTGEQCDDGAKNGTAGDPCASNCTLVASVCGDGIVQGAEQCDPPNVATCTTNLCCSASCTLIASPPATACQTCETTLYTMQPARSDCRISLYSGPLGYGCDSFASAADRAACAALRTCLLTSNCAAGDDVAPCYCGARNATDCAANGPDGTGACLAQYNAVTLPAGKKVADVFTSVSSPIGVADNLAICDIDANCPCP
jgi:cysteine-rich repeat protein